jgi:hypothetical protein
MRENMGPTQQKVALGVGSAAAAAAIFAPLRYKWKGLLSAVAFSGIFSGITGFSLFNKVMGVRR